MINERELERFLLDVKEIRRAVSGGWHLPDKVEQGLMNLCTSLITLLEHRGECKGEPNPNSGKLQTGLKNLAKGATSEHATLEDNLHTLDEHVRRLCTLLSTFYFRNLGALDASTST